MAEPEPVHRGRPTTAFEDRSSCAPAFNGDFQSRLLTLFRWRRDVRHFQSTPVPADIIEALFETASLAPSVGLSQPWRFVMVDAPERRAVVRANFERCNAEALAGLTPARSSAYARLKLAGLDEAPSQFAVFAEPDPLQGHGLGRRSMPETTAYSAVMAVHTLWLAARAQGIGLGWVSILDPPTVSAVLDVPKAWTFIGYFCMGYPQIEAEMPELQRVGWERRRSAAVAFIQR